MNDKVKMTWNKVVIAHFKELLLPSHGKIADNQANLHKDNSQNNWNKNQVLPDKSLKNYCYCLCYYSISEQLLQMYTHLNCKNCHICNMVIQMREIAIWWSFTFIFMLIYKSLWQIKTLQWHKQFLPCCKNCKS